MQIFVQFGAPPCQDWPSPCFTLHAGHPVGSDAEL